MRRNRVAVIVVLVSALGTAHPGEASQGKANAIVPNLVGTTWLVTFKDFGGTTDCLSFDLDGTFVSEDNESSRLAEGSYHQSGVYFATSMIVQDSFAATFVLSFSGKLNKKGTKFVGAYVKSQSVSSVTFVKHSGSKIVGKRSNCGAARASARPAR